MLPGVILFEDSGEWVIAKSCAGARLDSLDFSKKQSLPRSRLLKPLSMDIEADRNYTLLVAICLPKVSVTNGPTRQVTKI
jgi:hypothetical protein